MVRITKHVVVRMSQRGFTGEMVEFVLKYGFIRQDKFVLRRRDLEELVATMVGEERVIALKLLDKGGAVVVEANGHLVTTYNFDSFDRRRLGQVRQGARRPRAYR